MISPPRVVFLGSDAIALSLLDWLHSQSGAVILGVYTQPDRATGRGQKVTPNAIKTWAEGRALPVWQPERLTPDVQEQFAALAPDLAIVMAYGHLLKDEFIATPRGGTLNLHTSILPRYRGASPIQTAVASGERETGVTLMRIVRRLDAGPVAGVERVRIEPTDTAVEVEAKLAAACVPLVSRLWPALLAGTAEFAAQDEAAATYCRKLAKEDGVLDFRAPARELAARIHGLHPWPGCRFEFQGQPIRTVGATASTEAMSAVPGTVLAGAAGLRVATGDGVLELHQLQRPGGRLLPAGEFLRGFPIPAGSVLASVPMPPLVAAQPFLSRR